MNVSRAGFVAELHALKEASPLSYKALAKKLDSSVSTVHGWCTGKHIPYPRETDKFEVLLRELGVDDTKPWLEALARLRRRPADDNPYLGLNAYSESDADRFHGRSELTATLIADIVAGFDGQGHPPMVVIGPSGVGKSSLLRAGLVAGLNAREDIVAMATTPQLHPIEALDSISTWMSEHAGQHQVIVIDQFEEIFSPTNKQQAQYFLDELAEMTADCDVQTVVGLRADYYQRATKTPWLRHGLEQRHTLVPPLSRASMTECIVRPADNAGMTVAPDLLIELVTEFTKYSGLAERTEALPLLSHVLFLLAEKSPQVLTLERLRKIGGLAHAISQAAEAAYTTLDDERRHLSRQIFTHLVELEDDGTMLRRPLDLTTFWTNSSDAAIDDVIEVFTQARLLTLDGNNVTISHEALLKSWGRLEGWIDEERGTLHIVRRIAVYATAWDEMARVPSAALQGTLLDDALMLLGGSGWFRLTSTEIEFITASQQLRNQQQRRDADVTSRQLALQSSQLRNNDPILSAQIAVLAHRAAPTVEARSAVAAATSPMPGARSLGTPGEVRLDLSGNQQVAIASNGPNESIRIFDCDANTIRLRQEFPNPAGQRVAAVAVDFAGERIAIGSAGGEIWVHELSTGHQRNIGRPDDFSGAVHALAFARNDEWLVAAGAGPAVIVLNPLTGERIGAFPCPATALSLSISSDASRLGVGSADGTLTIWRSRTGHVLDDAEPWHMPHPQGSPASCVRFDPNDNYVIAGYHNGRIRVWDTAKGRALTERPLTSAPFSSWVNDIGVSQSGDHVAVASSDGTVRFFTAHNWQEVRPELSPGSVVTSVRFIGPGHAITAAESGTIRAWALPSALKAEVDSTIWTITLDTTGASVITGSGGRCVLWSRSNSTKLQVEQVYETGSTDMVFSGAGAISSDGALVAFGTRTGEVLFGPSRRLPLAVLPGSATSLIDNVTFGADGQIVAAIEAAGQLFVWDTAGPEPVLLAALPVPVRPLDLAMSADSTLLAVVSETNELVLVDMCDLGNIRPVSTTSVADSFAMSVAFHPTKPIVAIGSADRTVSLWECADPAHPSLLSRLGDAEGHQVAVAFNADGSRVAAAGTDAKISIWNVADMQQPTLEYRLLANGAGAYSVAFAPDADVCLGAGPNQQIDAWLLDPDAAAQAFDAIGGDSITAAEWARYVPESVRPHVPA